MNYKFDVAAGGIFSKFITIITNSVLYEIDDAYINIVDDRTNADMFSHIFSQKYDKFYINKLCYHFKTYNNNIKIENSINLEKYKLFISKLKLKDTILEKIEYYQKTLSIDHDTVGVHIRLTDMNIHHQNEYGVSDLNSYILKMSEFENSNFFVASDNDESIEKLIGVFGDRIKYVNGMIRAESSSEDTMNLQINNFKNEEFWIQAFLEMFLLSKCGTLICRTSNLSNVSILYSETLNNIIRI